MGLAEPRRFDHVDAYGVEAVTIAEQTNHIYSLATGLFGHGAATLQQRDIVEAEALLQRAMSLSQQYCIPVLERLVLSELAHARTLRGAYQDAISLLERVIDSNDSSPTTARRALFLARLGEAYLGGGRFGDAT